MKKIIIALILMILITGCSNKELIKTYNNMKASKDMNGYSINLKIYGKIGNKSYNEALIINNYNDEKFLIKEIFRSRKINIKERLEPVEKLTYVLNGKIYQEENEEYKEISSYKYSNPLIYLEGLKNIKKTISETEETIAKNKYKVYEVEVKKVFLNKLLKEIGISGNLKENETALIYVNNEGHLYKIMYEIEELKINVNYSGINSSRDIELPN